MGIFDSLKKSLGVSKKKPQTQRLGTRDDQDNISRGEFNLVFTEATIGLEVDNYFDVIKVVYVAAGKEADAKGVKEGDIVVSLEGSHVTSPEVFASSVRAIERPFTVRYVYRISLPIYLYDNTRYVCRFRDPSFSTQTPSSSVKQSAFNFGRKAAPPVLSDAEKDARRRAMANAASLRGQTNTWEKKGSGKSLPDDPLADISDTGDQAEMNPDTLAVINKAKAREQQLISEMGYNPFKPVMASTGKSTVASSSSSNNSNSSNNGSNLASPKSPAKKAAPKQNEVWTQQHEFLVEGLCDEALAMLLSMGSLDGDDSTTSANSNNVSTCITTTLKMLDNIKRNPNEMKFRYVFRVIKLILLCTVIYLLCTCYADPFESRTRTSIQKYIA